MPPENIRPSEYFSWENSLTKYESVVWKKEILSCDVSLKILLKDQPTINDSMKKYQQIVWCEIKYSLLITLYIVLQARLKQTSLHTFRYKRTWKHGKEHCDKK